MIGNGSHASAFGVGSVDLKFTSEKIVWLKIVQHALSINKNLNSGSLLCREGFKLVFESNKVVVLRYGQFIGKGYESRDLFHFLLSDFYNKVVKHVCDSNNSVVDIWHSCFCYINFGCMTCLSSMNLILSFSTVKGSKCQTCVQAKQPRKPHKAVDERCMTLLELIHSNICEMNGVLTKGEKRYFMTLIDDATKYCYMFLLKAKDNTFECFKTYKAKVENQLENKIKRVRSDHGGEYFCNEFDLFVCGE